MQREIAKADPAAWPDGARRDFTTGRVFNIAAATPPTLTLTTGFASGLNISSFAEAIDGELYVVHYGGALYRIVP